ncbi:uncharacterized protein LOC132179990 isoform X1 [Corylus avellana]|uniref:uncharacterized protein LOC132179990 isoform X1 n=1 Tax=Corylus avellana TaxID=13451 RepID=UPI00286CA25B|nr:uncharacterized protein LOC132179990 isoform X1 [Corylus avellana]
MASSSTSVNNIDLSFAPTVQLNVMPDAHPDVPTIHPDILVVHPDMPAVHPDVWQPTFTFDDRPITIHDTVKLHDSTAMAVAKGLATPRDQTLLADRSDFDAINNSLAYSIQGAASVSDMARRLSDRNVEMKILRNQVGALQQRLKYYKQKHVNLKKKNTKPKKLVVLFAEDRGVKVVEMEKTARHLQQQHEKLQVDV